MNDHPEKKYESLEDIFSDVSESLRPPRRMTVSEAAEKYRYLYNPGSYVGRWKNDITPYLIEFMDVLTDLSKTGAIFVAGAQTGKTDCFVNWLLYTVTCDPADMMIVEKSNTEARDFSKRRIDRLHDHSKKMKKYLSPKKKGDNVYDKKYLSGMLVTLGWPSKNKLSGKPISRLWLSDYDRMPLDVDGEGSAYNLAAKRATTFGYNGMTVAESSPSRPVENVHHIPSSRHEAPPSAGILSLYNKGDRRRWYWICVKCKISFEPSFKIMQWPDLVDINEAAELSYICCPGCQARYYDHDTKLPGKSMMNREHACWIKDGMFMSKDGKIEGKPFKSDIASFWLKGPASAFMPFKTIVANYLYALREYELTGCEESIKTTVNVDQAEAYIPIGNINVRSPENIKSTARDYGIRMVPHGVRFLVASIDLQKNRFVVQVHGIGTDKHGKPDFWIVDRFNIRKSRRLDEDGERFWVNPGAYVEDWRQLTDEVILKTYELLDGSGRHMSIKLTVSDSAGLQGFTANAYHFVRWLRQAEASPDKNYVWKPGLASRFQLLRGSSRKNPPRVQLTFPDSGRKDRWADARGEIPVVEINTNSIKDSIDKMLDRTEPGGRINFPEWLEINFYKELTVEVKDVKKGWQNPKGYRNESWDLLVYAMAACLMPQINLENINWQEPPGWAKPWHENDLVFNPEKSDSPLQPRINENMDLTTLGEFLA